MRVVKSLSTFLFLFIFLLSATGQTTKKTYSYKEYLSLAINENLLLISEKYKLQAAEARVSLAKIFPNPLLTIGNATGDITGQHLQQQIYVGVNQTIPRANKIETAVKVAQAEMSVEQALYEDYLRVFKVDITKRFVNALIAEKNYERNKISNDLLQKELKLKIEAPNSNSIEVSRLKIESAQLLDQLYQAEEELHNATYELYPPLQNFNRDSLMLLTGNIRTDHPPFNVDSVIPIALEQRSDIVLYRKKNLLAQEHEQLIKMNRKKDFDIQLGDNYFTEATNIIAPTPAYHAITAMITVPIAFSNLHKEDLQIAKLQKQSSESEMLYAKNMLQVQIHQSHENFKIAEKQLRVYSAVLIDADQIVKEELNNYKSGKSSFLDLSESHRKQDEVYSGYFRALKTYIYSLIELEDDIGVWDIDF